MAWKFRIQFRNVRIVTVSFWIHHVIVVSYNADGGLSKWLNLKNKFPLDYSSLFRSGESHDIVWQIPFAIIIINRLPTGRWTAYRMIRPLFSIGVSISTGHSLSGTCENPRVWKYQISMNLAAEGRKKIKRSQSTLWIILYLLTWRAVITRGPCRKYYFKIRDFWFFNFGSGSLTAIHYYCYYAHSFRRR